MKLHPVPPDADGNAHLAIVVLTPVCDRGGNGLDAENSLNVYMPDGPRPLVCGADNRVLVILARIYNGDRRYNPSSHGRGQHGPRACYVLNRELDIRRVSRSAVNYGNGRDGAGIEGICALGRRAAKIRGDLHVLETCPGRLPDVSEHGARRKRRFGRVGLVDMIPVCRGDLAPGDRIGRAGIEI